MNLEVAAAARKAVEIYQIVLGDPGRTFRFASVLLPIILVVAATTTLVAGHAEKSASHAAIALLGTLDFVLLCWAGTNFAIRWHRYALLGEADADFYRVAFGRRAWRYFWQLLLIILLLMLVLALPVAAATMLVMPFSGSALYVPLWSTVVVCIDMLGVFVLARAGLALPAVAVDQRMSLRQSWRLTRELSGPFFSLVLLVSLPLLVWNWLNEVMIGASPPPWLAIPLAVVGTLLVFLYIAVVAVALSSNYQALLTHPSYRPDLPQSPA